MPEHDPIEIQAFADGELPPDRADAVRRAVAQDPALAAEVETARALRTHARRVLVESTPAPAAGLLARINALPLPDARPAPRPEPAPVVVTITPRPSGQRFAWVAAAAALLLCAGVWVTMRAAPPAPTPVIVPASLVTDVTKQHLMCSQIEDHFLLPGLPRVHDGLPEAASAYLGAGASVPDLSAMGYAFAGAGPCSIPGGKTLHVLYRSAGSTVSVFIQPDEGQLAIPPDRVVSAAGPTAEYPLLIWRTGGLVYYLIADSFQTAARASHAMGQSI